MAMGKRRRCGRQPSMWVASSDLPRSAGHPFYERLNRVLDAAGFDAFIVVARVVQHDSVAPLPARARKPVLRVTQGSLFTLPRGPFSSCRYQAEGADQPGAGTGRAAAVFRVGRRRWCGPSR